MQIYNSLTQKKENFQPIQSNQVKMYVCGPTVYDYIHMGNARSFTAFDVIVRYLQFKGYEVSYVRNITDIDDKIIKRANENNEDFSQVVDRFTQAFREDCQKLNLLKPTYEPTATSMISEIISLIEKLIANQSAYVASNGDVYFDVRHFKKYGCLSHHNIDELESGARVEITDVKKDPLDFVLWKLAKPNEPFWNSPWGVGRPGWHIECSAMSLHLLGNSFDIHGGGKDLIFPHHENELAQSEAATGEHFVNIWMHAGYLQIEKEKMSKSLGNFFTVRDVLQKYPAEVLRLFLISGHYRSQLQYGEEGLKAAQASLDRFYTALKDLPVDQPILGSEFENKFVLAMDDDFNTPIAFSVLFDLAHEINRLRLDNISEAAKHAALLKKLANVFGLLESPPELFFQRKQDEMDIEKIKNLIGARNKARAEKNWAEADRVRDELMNMSIILEDGPDGTSWKVKS